MISFFGTKHRKKTLAHYVVISHFFSSHVLVSSVLHSNFHLKKVTTIQLIQPLFIPLKNAAGSTEDLKRKRKILCLLSLIFTTHREGLFGKRERKISSLTSCRSQKVFKRAV